MNARRFSIWTSCVAVAFIALSWAALADEQAAPKLAEEVGKAERILIGTPQKDVDVAGGQQFLVEINQVLRGTGEPGKLARIANSGDARNHPRFKAGQKYVFLLAKNQSGKGWVNLAQAELPVTDGNVQHVVGGKAIEEVSLDAFKDVVATNKPAGAAPARDSLVGKWVLVVNQQGFDVGLWLIEITKADESKFEARLLETSKIIGASTLQSGHVSDTDAHLEFQAQGMTFDFEGRLEGGTVRGSSLIRGEILLPARLVATNATSMRSYDEPKPAPEGKDFMSAIQQEKSFAPLQKFVARHSDSPLVLSAYEQMIALAKDEGYDEAKFRKLADDYLDAARGWGPRLEFRALANIGVTLSRTGFLPELAMTYVTAVREKFDDQTPRALKQLIDTEEGRLLIATGQAEQGIELLKKVREEDPFQGGVTLALAQQAEGAGQTDEAIELYGEISALPGMEGVAVSEAMQRGEQIAPSQRPSRVLARLWKEKHGDTKGLDGFLNELYEKRIKSLAGAAAAPRQPGEGTRIVLCELFTGAMCPPCVAADVATTVLESAFAKSEVIVLRYHMDIPAPDPLANSESAERFEDVYNGSGTPTLVINGTPFEGAGGYMSHAADLYTRLREAVQPVLGEQTDLRIDMSAQADGGKVAISAKAAGLDEFSDNLRLVVAIVEDRIDFVAGNGIRVHDMVVRALPAGAEGAEADDGKLEYSSQLDVADLKSKLEKELTKKEERESVEFEAKPFDFKALHVVAFVQNLDNNEVLQAAAVPVTGTLSVTQADTSEKKGAKAKAASNRK